MPELSTVLKLAAGLGLPAADLIEGMEWISTELGEVRELDGRQMDQ